MGANHINLSKSANHPEFLTWPWLPTLGDPCSYLFPAQETHSIPSQSKALLQSLITLYPITCFLRRNILPTTTFRRHLFLTESLFTLHSLFYSQVKSARNLLPPTTPTIRPCWDHDQNSYTPDYRCHAVYINFNAII